MLLNGWLIIGFKENSKFQLVIWHYLSFLTLAVSAFFKVFLFDMLPLYAWNTKKKFEFLDLDFNDSNWWIIILLCTTVLDCGLRCQFDDYTNTGVLDNITKNTDEERKPLIEPKKNSLENVESNIIENKETPRILYSCIQLPLWMHARLGSAPAILRMIFEVILSVILVACFVAYLLVGMMMFVFVFFIPIKLALLFIFSK
jgi:hypothetical protein